MEERDYTQRVKDVLIFSREEAARLGNDHIGPEHLLLGIIREGEGTAISALLELNVDINRLKKEIEDKIAEPTPLDVNAPIAIDNDAYTVLKFAALEARKLGSQLVDTEHIILGILRHNMNKAAQSLENQSVTYDSFYEELHNNGDVSVKDNQPSQGGESDMFDARDDDDDEGPENMSDNNGFGNVQSDHTSKTPVLDSFGTDMTKAAAEGKLDPVVGREKEVERVIEILCRRKKNNPVLIGEPGVGKSSIVEGLAQKIVDKTVAPILFDKRIVSLDISSLVAGTKYRGQFEERLKSLLAELTKNPDVILFIDEIHTIIGAGNSQGSLDAANILKPSLARGVIQCIGATTLKEYRESIEKDGALERRFQKILVEPTSKEETLQILKNIKDRYEEHHCVNYSDEALEACVKYTDRYISDRAFPDKAIDALDEAGARAHVHQSGGVPSIISELEKQISFVKAKKQDAFHKNSWELASSYRDQEKKLNAQLDVERKKWTEQLRKDRKTVTADDIRQVVSVMSGVPIQRIGKDEGETLIHLKDKLQEQVIGQNEAVDKVVMAIRRNRLGLKDPNRPIGSFIFLGPTGVGKTHLAQVLAEEMFGSQDSLIRIDMSEFMEKYSVSRLIGAPPGYVGYEEGGQLTERVRRHPYSIVLLDEIEKAHPDVYNLLLQVLDEGRLTDSLGRTIDFKNTIIILTSNVGSRQLKEFGTGIGFSKGDEAASAEQARGVITKALNKTFSPEFLNRIDDIITFNQLDKASIRKIIELELKKVYQRVEGLGYKLTITEDAKDFIASKGYDVQYGARPLKRAVQRYVEDELTQVLLDSKPAAGDEIVLDVDNDKKKIIPNILPANLRLLEDEAKHDAVQQTSAQESLN